MKANEGTLRKLAIPAGVTAAGAAIGVVIANRRQQSQALASGLAQGDGASRQATASETRRASGTPSLPSSELRKRQKAREERRKQRRRKLKT